MPNVFSRVDEANIAAVRAYNPKPYSGTVVIFRALRQAQFDERSNNGWDDIGVKHIIIHEVDCYHGNILFEPFVRQIAETINQYLNNSSDMSS
jgi:thioesterase domain-containing protein